MFKILVTGASGFIGKNLCRELVKSNRSIKGTVRNLNSMSINNNLKYFSIGNIDSKTSWNNALLDTDCIIHCAGIAHKISKKDEIDVYRSVNTEGTKRLAEQAAKAGVKRLIFLSSVKVNGEATDKINSNTILNDQTFTHNDLPDPQDAYALSKLEAEKELWEISSRTNLEIVVLRLPLVYGHGVKGNLKRFMKLINSNIPLPFSLVKNQRSLIGIDNLVDLIIRCIDHSDAVGKTFLVSDGEDLSTPNLVNHIASFMGRTSYLFPIPIFLLRIAGSILGKKKEIDRLVGSLKIDSSYTQKVLNWTAPISVTEGIRRMVQGK